MNRLKDASSPYLRQHAENPVDWYEWGAEAFAEAKRRDVPVFLSVGYSSCHWCHVMAHESFEDEEVARILNERFVCVKVDREERPDIDSVYMGAVQAMTGRGGWPMSVFLTADGTPFFGGTYWPKTSQHNMPGFVAVLDAITTAWTDQRDQVDASGAQLAEHLAASNELGAPIGQLTPEVADHAADLCVRMWDRELGGFGQAPKFPQAMTIDFLLANHLRTDEPEPLEAAVHSLDAMAAGGIYDHVGGGFARYSTDERWLVPHFEKMLYDNALLLRAYTHAAQIVSDPAMARRMRRIAMETADYLLREMRDAQGGFYSATDADSEGVEGKFFVWSLDEFSEVVESAGESPEELALHYGVTAGGNFADPHHPEIPPASILHERMGRDELDEDFAARLDRVRAKLLTRRAERVPPGLDDKVLTSWNALALGALAEAGVALGEPRYVAAAAACATFLHEQMVVDGRLHHTWKDGHGPTVPAFLEDVSYLAQALLVLFEADPQPQWVAWAAQLAGDADARFAEVADGRPTGAYFTTAHDAEQLLTRPKDLWDNAQPAGSSVMADVHLRLYALTGDPGHLQQAERTIALFAPRAQQAPTGYGELLRALERMLSGPLEVAIVGDPAAAATAELVAEYQGRWRPGGVLAVGPEGSQDPPLLQNRPLVDGRSAAYVCRNFACDRPVTSAEELRSLLNSA